MKVSVKALYSVLATSAVCVLLLSGFTQVAAVQTRRIANPKHNPFQMTFQTRFGAVQMQVEFPGR